METGAALRSVPRSFEWRDHRGVARLPLQLDRCLVLDEKERRRTPALYRDGRLRDQTFAADADGRAHLPFSESRRIRGQQSNGRRYPERWRKNLRDLSRDVCRGDRRSSSVSPLVETTTAPALSFLPPTESFQPERAAIFR